MALSAALMDTDVSYGQLAEIEDQFEDVELEIIRQQDKMLKDVYAKRQKLVAGIPHFWALVMEQSPPDIDEYIQPQDSALLLSSLTSLSVERFELPSGDPRSVSIRFEFSENEHFENKVLEKKFWWRRSKDLQWEGYVSEPVSIKWRSADKDLTSGMLDLVHKVYEEEKAGKPAEEETPAKKELKALMDQTGLNGVSFFAWFGFRGRKVSAEEDQEAQKLEKERRAKRQAGEDVPEDDIDLDDEENEDEYEWEIFPTADDLAVSIAEDLWPSAIKYFTSAQEDGLSDIDFEESDEDEDEEMGDGDEQPSKKRKA